MRFEPRHKRCKGPSHRITGGEGFINRGNGKCEHQEAGTNSDHARNTEKGKVSGV